MKKLLIFFVGILLSTLLAAQPQKGNIMVGGNFSATYYHWDNRGSSSDYFMASLTPDIGYLFTPHFALGGSLQVDLFAANKDIYAGLGVIPWVRWYFGLTKDQRLQLFLRAGCGVNGGPYYLKRSDSTIINRYFEINPQAGVGLSFFITPNIALEGLLNYQFTYREFKFKYADETAYEKYIERNSQILFAVGFEVFIAKSKKEKEKKN